jgi:hypothetical protein
MGIYEREERGLYPIKSVPKDIPKFCFAIC